MTVRKKYMAHVRECVRLAGLTDDLKVRNQIIALARDWIAAANKEEKEEGEGKEDEGNDNVLLLRGLPPLPAYRNEDDE